MYYCFHQSKLQRAISLGPSGSSKVVRLRQSSYQIQRTKDLPWCHQKQLRKSACQDGTQDHLCFQSEPRYRKDELHPQPLKVSRVHLHGLRHNSCHLIILSSLQWSQQFRNDFQLWSKFSSFRCFHLIIDEYYDLYVFLQAQYKNRGLHSEL